VKTRLKQLGPQSVIKTPAVVNQPAINSSPKTGFQMNKSINASKFASKQLPSNDIENRHRPPVNKSPENSPTNGDKAETPMFQKGKTPAPKWQKEKLNENNMQNEKEATPSWQKAKLQSSSLQKENVSQPSWKKNNADAVVIQKEENNNWNKAKAPLSSLQKDSLENSASQKEETQKLKFSSPKVTTKQEQTVNTAFQQVNRDTPNLKSSKVFNKDLSAAVAMASRDQNDQNEESMQPPNFTSRLKSKTPSEVSPQRALPEVPPVAASSENDLTVYPWYFGSIDRKDAEPKIRNINQDGAFLVRDSSKGGQNPYALTLLFSNAIFNLHIRKRPDGKFALGTAKEDEHVFNTVNDLVTFHTNNAIEVLGKVSGKVKLVIIATS